MTTGSLNKVIHHLRGTLLAQDGGAMTDGELLAAFLADRNEVAFESLVRRHGPMVMGVCQRVIGNPHDAEDAFQATFLVLARKASSVSPREAVGNWLYGVAYRTALDARGKIARRHAKEKQVLDMPHPRVQPEELWQELAPLIDQELNRLPDKYRLPLILCELEGGSRKDVARQLRLPEGTLSSRLATARKMLAKRLSGRGVTISAGVLATVLSQNAASAWVPAPLVVSTVQAAGLFAAGETAAGLASAKALALTQGVLKTMLITKIKVSAVWLLAVSVLTLASGVLVHRSLADVPVNPPVIAIEQSETPAPAPSLVAVQRPKKDVSKTGPTVTGTLQSVDADSVTISNFVRKEGKTEKTYTIAKNAKFLRDGKEIKLADIKKGVQATLTLSADQKSVVSLSTITPPIQGSLKSVDTVKSSITVTAGARAAKEDKTYQVAKDVKITIDGKESNLADLKEGAPVSLSLNDTGAVVQIRTGMRKDRKQDE